MWLIIHLERVGCSREPSGQSVCWHTSLENPNAHSWSHLSVGSLRRLHLTPEKHFLVLFKWRISMFSCGFTPLCCHSFWGALSKLDGGKVLLKLESTYSNDNPPSLISRTLYGSGWTTETLKPLEVLTSEEKERICVNLKMSRASQYTKWSPSTVAKRNKT